MGEKRTAETWLLMLLTTGLFVVPSPVLGAEEERPDAGILVWRIEAKTGVTEKDIDSLSGLLTAKVEKRSGRKVISESEVQTVVMGEQKKIQCGVNDTSCMAEIGGALGVPEVISGDLGRVGDVWILNLRRIDVRKVKVLSRVSRQSKGDITTMVDALSDCVSELFREGEVVSVSETVTFEPYKTWGWLAAGAGTGLLAFGGVSTLLAYKYRDEYDRGDRSAKNRNGTWSSLAVAGYTVGVAAVAGGVALLLLDPGKGGAESQGFIPVVDEKGAWVAIFRRW